MHPVFILHRDCFQTEHLWMTGAPKPLGKLAKLDGQDTQEPTRQSNLRHPRAHEKGDTNRVQLLSINIWWYPFFAASEHNETWLPTRSAAKETACMQTCTFNFQLGQGIPNSFSAPTWKKNKQEAETEIEPTSSTYPSLHHSDETAKLSHGCRTSTWRHLNHRCRSSTICSAANTYA